MGDIMLQLNKLYNMDCMEGMAQFPDKYFELAIVDPPYGLGFDKEKPSMSAGLRKDGTRRRMETWNNPKEKGYAAKEWDKKRPDKEYFDMLINISKKQIIWGGNYFTDYLPPSGGWIVWDKGVPDGMSLSQAELAWTNCLNSVIIARFLWAGYKKCEKAVKSTPPKSPLPYTNGYSKTTQNPATKFLILM